MKTIFIVLPVFASFLSLVSPASAVSWKTTDVLSNIEEVGQLSDVTIDPAGRVHTVSVSDNGTGSIIWYKMRPNASTGFTESGARTLVDARNASSEPLSVSIGVTDDFTTQIAVADEAGVVKVYELASGNMPDSSWSSTEISALGWADSRTGVSIRSRGDTGYPSSSLVFTRAGVGDNANGVALFSQRGDGTWGFDRNIFTGAGTGMGARLINVSRAFFATAHRVVVSYDETAQRIEAAVERRSGGIPGSVQWMAPEAVSDTPVPTFSRPGGDAALGQVGVSFVPTINDGVHYVSLGASGWSGGRITTNDERAAESDIFGGFTRQTAVALDAGGQPWVAYSRIVGAGSQDVRARRFIPGLGWKMGVVETFNRVLGRLTSSIALATGENGDPALVYERDRGPDQSDFVFARPRPTPWVVGRPGELDEMRQTFAPALATSLDGDFHLVTSASTGGGFSLPGFPAPALVYRDRRLLTFSGGSVTDVEIPSSANPYVANAVTTTPDGTVHIVSLRLTTPSSPAGDLLYSSGPASGPIASPPGAALVTGDISDVVPGPVVLKSDASGNLFVAYLKAGGGAEIRTRAPRAASWEPLAILGAASVAGMDLAVRDDGGVALSYYDATRTGTGPDGAQVRLFSDFSPRNGRRTPGFDDYNAFYLAPGDGEPENTACAILPDGLPRIALGLHGALKYLRPLAAGPTNFASYSPVTGFGGATLKMLVRGNKVHVLAHTLTEDGTLRHASFPDSSPMTVGANDLFVTPALGLSAFGRTPLAAALDAAGEPVMAAGVNTGGGVLTLFSTDQVILARPADALDDDGDGIPLLHESAHCLSRFNRDPESFLPQGSARLRSSGSVALSYGFRTNPVPSTNGTTSQRQFGEFVYRFEVGNDLVGWAPETPVAGSVEGLAFLLDVSEPTYQTRNIGFGYHPGFVSSNRERFCHLRVTRDR